MRLEIPELAIVALIGASGSGKPGNHDIKLLRKLKGRNVKIDHGLDNTLQELEQESAAFVSRAAEFIHGLVSHYVFDGGRLVAAHAGLKETMQGRSSGKVRDFCLYGETTGEIDAYGLPVRLDWAEEYRGKAAVVYGHTPQVDVQNINNTWCIDTGCVFGGKLTALRYPEREIVSVPARQIYYQPLKPLAESKEGAGDVLNIRDVSGKRHLSTRLDHGVVIDEASSMAALDLISRFAVDPHWLIYLPPTMSPCETSRLDGVLEHPLEAFEYYKARGVGKVICEQKHMGSRAVVVLARDAGSAEKHFQAGDGKQGIIYTRTGRHFFGDDSTEREIIKRLAAVLEQTGFWGDFNSEWVCLDTEIMPWSAKALELLQRQYAPVGCAGRRSLAAAVELLAEAEGRNLQPLPVESAVSGQNAGLGEILHEHMARSEALQRYTEAYRRYCWTVESVDDYRIAPFHLLATEGAVHYDKDHLWHLNAIARYIAAGDNIFISTDCCPVDLHHEGSVEDAVRWWENLTNAGGEGMVVKPLSFIAVNKNKLLQPAVKCRGKEYLRIIYGPEYSLEDNLARLKKRSLNRKRRLALQEFALGLEALERFVEKQPLYRVHECVFGVLALESEPVDPRL